MKKLIRECDRCRKELLLHVGADAWWLMLRATGAGMAAIASVRVDPIADFRKRLA